MTQDIATLVGLHMPLAETPNDRNPNAAEDELMISLAMAECMSVDAMDKRILKHGACRAWLCGPGRGEVIAAEIPMIAGVEWRWC